MIKIANIEVQASEADLNESDVVFTITFESDLKALICHAHHRPVREALEELLTNIQNEPYYTLELTEALEQSAFIIISVDHQKYPSLSALINRKFELIKENNTLVPSGHNLWLMEYSVVGLPKALVRKCLMTDRPKKSAGRNKKPVYQYAKRTDGSIERWILFAKWPSITDLCKTYPSYSRGNISSACNNPSKTAYGFKWSYSQDEIFE